MTYLGPRMRVRALFQFLLALDSGLSWMGGALPSSFRLRATATEKMVTLDRRSSSNSSLLKKTNEKIRKFSLDVLKWGSIAQWLAYLLLSQQPQVRFPAFSKKFQRKNCQWCIGQRRCLEESGQWIENVDRSHLVLASGRLVLQKCPSLSCLKLVDSAKSETKLQDRKKTRSILQRPVQGFTGMTRTLV